MCATAPKPGSPFSSFKKACRDPKLYDVEIEAEMDLGDQFWGGAAGGNAKDESDGRHENWENR